MAIFFSFSYRISVFETNLDTEKMGRMEVAIKYGQQLTPNNLWPIHSLYILGGLYIPWEMSGCNQNVDCWVPSESWKWGVPESHQMRNKIPLHPPNLMAYAPWVYGVLKYEKKQWGESLLGLHGWPCPKPVKVLVGAHSCVLLRRKF